ncbi:MAG: Wadjet anti-phage system protein JetD domain-containing protein [Myxococcota bacterium]|nr:Wadjet anti-phage system protein JetD domain-containing protein [Myxococcota bacterium]
MERLARRLIDLRPMRWSTLTRFAKRGIDRVDVEETANGLFQAGWLEFRHKRDRAGNLAPTQMRLLESAVDDASALIGTPSPTQREQTLVRLRDALIGLRDHPRPPIPERVLVRKLFGNTKSVRIRDLRAELETAVGVPLEDLVRFHVDVALTAGPARFHYRGVPVDLRGSSPWTAITEPVAAELSELVLEEVDELLCVENQTPFESLLYEGFADTSMVLFTAGYLGTVQRNWIRQLLNAGIRRVRHWGDLDPWGLDIYRDLRSFVLEHAPAVDVSPWRMEPEPLKRSDTQKLTTEDWVALHRYLKRKDAPLRETAEAMRSLGRKLEQEALLE